MIQIRGVSTYHMIMRAHTSPSDAGARSLDSSQNSFFNYFISWLQNNLKRNGNLFKTWHETTSQWKSR